MTRDMRAFGAAAISAAILIGAGFARANGAEPAAPQGQEVPIPKPGPEHEILKQDVGVWDATVESRMEPNGTPEVTKGVETNVLLGKGLWLIQDYRGAFMGMPFHGHTILGYDASRKKYVGTWVDSMSPGLWETEGSFDPETETMTTWMEGPCPLGIHMRVRSTSERKDANTRVFTMYSPEGHGEEFVMMKITYTRRSHSPSPSKTD